MVQAGYNPINATQASGMDPGLYGRRFAQWEWTVN
jgi:hypothetical protein